MERSVPRRKNIPMFCFLFQQEDRKQLLRSKANQLLLDAKLRGSLTNIDMSSPTSEHPPGGFGSADDNSPDGEERPFTPPTKSNNPADFRKNPFKIVKKKNLKQVTPKTFLKEEKPAPKPAEPKGRFFYQPDKTQN